MSAEIIERKDTVELGPVRPGSDIREQAGTHNAEHQEDIVEIREKEYKVTEIDGKLLRSHLEAESFVQAFDGEVTDIYFELSGERGAQEVLGDFPRIRHKKGKGKIWNTSKNKFEEVKINVFEFNFKGKIKKAEGDIDNAEATFKFEVGDPRYPNEQAARQSAISAMAAYITAKTNPDVANQLVEWSTVSKNRTSYKKKDHPNVELDKWKSQTIVLVAEYTLPQPLEIRVDNGKKRVYASGTVFKKGQKLQINLSKIPEYAEFEILYRDEKDPQTKLQNQNRESLVQNLEAKGILKQSNKLVGFFGKVFEKYGIPPDFGTRKSPEKPKTSAEGEKKPAGAEVVAPIETAPPAPDKPKPAEVAKTVDATPAPEKSASAPKAKKEKKGGLITGLVETISRFNRWWKKSSVPERIALGASIVVAILAAINFGAPLVILGYTVPVLVTGGLKILSIVYAFLNVLGAYKKGERLGEEKIEAITDRGEVARAKKNLDAEAEQGYTSTGQVIERVSSDEVETWEYSINGITVTLETRKDSQGKIKGLMTVQKSGSPDTVTEYKSASELWLAFQNTYGLGDKSTRYYKRHISVYAEYDLVGTPQQPQFESDGKTLKKGRERQRIVVEEPLQRRVNEGALEDLRKEPGRVDVVLLAEDDEKPINGEFWKNLGKGIGQVWRNIWNGNAKSEERRKKAIERLRAK